MTKQAEAEADALAAITPEYPYRKLNQGVVRVNIQLAQARQPEPIRR